MIKARFMMDLTWTGVIYVDGELGTGKLLLPPCCFESEMRCF